MQLHLQPYPTVAGSSTRTMSRHRATSQHADVEYAHSQHLYGPSGFRLQVKAALTELLNTSCIRSDAQCRTCIQDLLLDTEQQIRKGRRHKPKVHQEMAASMAALSIAPEDQLKPALLDLLNMHSVRSDKKCRVCIQELLMDTEHQIRKRRRYYSWRDGKIVASIAAHFICTAYPRLSYTAGHPEQTHIRW